MVLHDLPKSTTPLTVTTSDFKYIRFHGPDGRYRGSYSDSVLSDLCRIYQKCHK